MAERSNTSIWRFVRKNCFERCICFKGGHCHCRNGKHFRAKYCSWTEELDTLMKGEMVYKDFRFYFCISFFAIEFRRLVRLLPITIKNIWWAQKFCNQKKFIDPKYSETSEYSKSSKYFGSSEISDVSKYSTGTFVWNGYSLFHILGKNEQLFLLFLKIFMSRGI